MELIVMILLGVCVFMFSVYFTRWVFGIDQIINLQKDILKELKNINSKKENIVFVCASGGRSELAKIIVQEKILEKNMYNLYAWENLENVK